MELKLPNFLIVGATKGGTTSLYYYLRQHPEVYAPHNKEPYFFISSIIEKLNPADPMYNGVRNRTTFTLEQYAELFEQAKSEKVIGEASVKYLYYYDVAIPQIKRYIGDAKIIIVLRNPVDRAFSAYIHLIRDQIESLSFEKCLELEEERIRQNWFPLHFCKDLGFYYQQVKAYMENFSRVKIRLYEDFKSDALGVVKDIYSFLEVDPSFTPDMNKKHNVSTVPRVKNLQGFFKRYNHPLKKVLRPLLFNVIGKDNTVNLLNYFMNRNLKKLEMKPETRKYLIEIYRSDILMLQRLINRDLSDWLK